MKGPPRPLVLLGLVAASATAAYLGTLGHGFAYDDHRFVEGNPGLDAVAAAPWRAFDPATTSTEGAEPGMWRPVRTLSFALDRAVFGPGPAGPHLSSALLHGVATALVFALGMVLGLGDLAAAAGAAIFGLHPAQAEAVSWISARGDLLCAVFLLAATWAHLRARSWIPGLLFTVLAFLSKEAALAAPLLFVAADLWDGGGAKVRERWRRTGAACALLALFAGLRALALGDAGTTAGQGVGMGMGPLEMAAAQPALAGWYAVRVFLPTPGVFDHQVEPSALLALAALFVLVLLASWNRLGLPAAAARPARGAALWALAALFPVTLLQVVYPLKILAADRFLYLALAGPALAAGAAAAAAGPLVARGLLVASPLLLLATFPASARWESDAALWADTLAREPGHARALRGRAWAAESTDPEEACRLYARYVEKVPADPGGWFRLGITAERLGLLAPDASTRRGRLLTAAEALGKAVGIWTGGEVEGRRLGLAEALLARACVLAALSDAMPGKDEGAEMGWAALAEAERAHRAWCAEPWDRKEALRPRIEILKRWARAKGHAALLADLESPVPGPPAGGSVEVPK